MQCSAVSEAVGIPPRFGGEGRRRKPCGAGTARPAPLGDAPSPSGDRPPFGLCRGAWRSPAAFTARRSCLGPPAPVRHVAAGVSPAGLKLAAPCPWHRARQRCSAGLLMKHSKSLTPRQVFTYRRLFQKEELRKTT